MDNLTVKPYKDSSLGSSFQIIRSIPRFVATDVPQTETNALMNFFHVTDGPNWTNNTGWGVDPVVGNWHGVTVVNGHVTRLDLRDNGKTISGPGAPFLAALSELNYLNLSYTGVTGGISGYNSLVNLTYLHLANTEITGDISGFYVLDKLTYLNLNGTRITGDISGFYVLDELTYLSLANTGITGDISGFYVLDKLAFLLLYNTGVTGDISGFYVLDELTNLSLHSTGVTGDISGFYVLDKLTYLSLANTGITGDISGFISLVNLTRLWMSNTGVTGDIGGLSALVKLLELYLYNTGVDVNTTPVFVNPNGVLALYGPNQAPTWGTVESPTQVTLNIVDNLRNGWAITVTGGIPTWVQDMV